MKKINFAEVFLLHSREIKENFSEITIKSTDFSKIVKFYLNWIKLNYLNVSFN